jgi:probable rRNA maturation factor
MVLLILFPAHPCRDTCDEEAGLVIFEKKVVGLTERALGRFILRARRAAEVRGTVNVLVTSNAAMRTLNLKFRKKNSATDVLSFPSDSMMEGNRKSGTSAGDVAISAEIATQNAARIGHSTATEVKVLVLHGVLHLAGFDHEGDNGEMARQEAKLRRALGLPGSLTERVQSSGPDFADLCDGRARSERSRRRK